MIPPIPKGPLAAYADAQLAREVHRIDSVLAQLAPDSVQRDGEATVRVPLWRTRLRPGQAEIVPWRGLRGRVVGTARTATGLQVEAAFDARLLVLKLSLRRHGIRDEQRVRRGEPSQIPEAAAARAALSPANKRWLARTREENERRERSFRERHPTTGRA